jgi:BMFP domain-containing protein YqiC
VLGSRGPRAAGDEASQAVEESEMQSENKMFDDLVKMVNGVAGTFAGMGREAEASTREKLREWMAGTDFVSRDEFDAVKAMAAAARDENEILKSRIAALEAKVAGPAAGTKRPGKATGTAEA